MNPALRPQIALALCFEAALLALLLEHTANLALLAALACAWWLAGGGARYWLWTLLLVASGTWSLMVTQGLFYAAEPRTGWLRLLGPEQFPWGQPPGLYLYREGVLYGLEQSLRADVMILLAAGLLGRYGPDQLAAGLRALGLPAALCLLAAMALRQVPLLAEEWRSAWLAQRLRGLRLRPTGAVLRAALLPMLAGNVRRADEIAAALQSRGIVLDGSALGGTSWATAAPAGQRLLAWAGAALPLAFTCALVLARLHQVGAASWPALDGLYRWMAAHG